MVRSFWGSIHFDRVRCSPQFFNFESAIFTENPTFYDAVLTANISFDKVTWPKECDPYHLTRAVNAYEHLALIMANLSKSHERHLFYRLEMQLRERLEANSVGTWTNKIYRILSDYGYAYERVLFFWILNLFAGVVLIFPFTNYRFAKPSFETIATALDIWSRSAVISFSNANSFLGLHKGALDDFYKQHAQYDLIIPFSYVWFFQSIFGFILIFLLGLTIRNRFKMN